MVFFNRKHRILETPFFEGFKDYHSHILPAVDDGVKNLERSLKVLDHYEQLKVSEVVLTPHVMNGINNNSDAIEAAFETLTTTYQGSIKLLLASEYMLDSNFMSHFPQRVRLIEGSNILVETSYFSAPRNLGELLYNIQVENITPIIAHPERYLYMTREEYHALKKSGYLFQLNLLSLSGAYGKRVAENAIYLLEQNMYNVIGSDLHSLRNFNHCLAKIKLKTKYVDMLINLKNRGL